MAGVCYRGYAREEKEEGEGGFALSHSPARTRLYALSSPPTFEKFEDRSAAISALVPLNETRNSLIASGCEIHYDRSSP